MVDLTGLNLLTKIWQNFSLWISIVSHHHSCSQETLFSFNQMGLDSRFMALCPGGGLSSKSAIILLSIFYYSFIIFKVYIQCSKFIFRQSPTVLPALIWRVLELTVASAAFVAIWACTKWTRVALLSLLTQRVPAKLVHSR